MDTAKTVLILGGGIGGVIAAQELRNRLPKQHRVILVDREREHVFSPSLLWVLTGDRRPEAIVRPLARVARRGVELRHGAVEKIDPMARSATVSGETLTADYLVVALGAELAPETIPGLAEAGHNFYTLAGAQALRDALATVTAGRVAVLTAAPMYKCPAAPYEAAMLIDGLLRKRKRHGAVGVEVYAAEPVPMGVAGPAVSKAVQDMLAAKGIGYHPGQQVTAVDAAAKRLQFAGGEAVAFDVLAYVPPHRAPKPVRECALAGETGWIPVDRHTLATRFPGVYALGDATTIPLKMGKPLPKAGVFAHAQAEAVAANIAAAIAGRDGTARFEGEGACFVETGDGKAAYGSGNFYGDPVPEVKLEPPARRWHAAKVLFEQSWLNLKV